jgi:arginine decarboxylase
MQIHIAGGIGTGPTKMAAFDSALNHIGVANRNIIRLSSIIPPKTEIKVHEKNPVPASSVPGQWGDRLYIVMAEQRVDTPYVEAWAGIGWVQDKETGKGLFVESEGESEQAVRRDIHAGLEGLMATRNVDFGPILMKVVGRTCSHQPVCAMVVAVYEARDWQN